MENVKVDISSTAIEKGIDLIAGFIEKLAGSSLEEAGLLLADHVKLRRLKNQIKIFSSAKKIAEENNFKIKQINLKMLVPLLEFSSLEEDETLQQKWCNLIVNFSDESQNYESSIFPFILNQLSSREVMELDKLKLIEQIEVNRQKRIASTKLSDIEISNLIRLGVLERIIIEGFPFYEPDGSVYYTVSALGKEFINCCSNNRKNNGVN
ncbi:Abi-alpha family protein [Flavobacterium luteolum]|uniref:Abi-alpha family protein n=1 Tax=Flavobacterium luteolum TaxID=3003259 RepID=UPI00248E4F0F|nr:Abi-alpha family protein [Flavobacterium luteolum]